MKSEVFRGPSTLGILISDLGYPLFVFRLVEPSGFLPVDLLCRGEASIRGIIYHIPYSCIYNYIYIYIYQTFYIIRFVASSCFYGLGRPSPSRPPSIRGLTPRLNPKAGAPPMVRCSSWAEEAQLVQIHCKFIMGFPTTPPHTTPH